MTLPVTLQQLTDLLACPAVDGATSAVTGTAIDSRKVKKGDVFIALSGQQVNGHQFLAAAREAGAVAALVSEKQPDSLPQIVVDDVVKAYGTIATFWRQQSTAKIVAITGSNGKTTLKEMIATILAEHSHTLATQGNFNNELGVPLTLTRLRAQHQYAVIEMGANHAGEIAQLVAMTEPDVAVINNIGPAHLEGFGSIEGIAKAKGEILSGLKASGVGVINADMAEFTSLWADLLKDRQQISFALETAADIEAMDIQMAAMGSHFMVQLDDICHFVTLPLPGKHNIANALAAIATCRALGIDIDMIVKGLGKVQPVKHRLQPRQAVNQALIIDDTYNANPSSFAQALKTLTSFPGTHWCVLGDFGELGADSQQIHQQMGQAAKQAGVSRLLTIGAQSQLAATAFGEGAAHFDSISTLQDELKNSLSSDISCLIKGSRFMQLDKLADALSSGGHR